jgi:hypothetical protein
MKEQFIHIDEDGDKLYYSDREMTIHHREDGPAVEYSNGSKSWYLNGKLHREDGPAIEHADAYKSWWLNGELHREDGPAIEYADGRNPEWYLNGKHLFEEEFNARMNPVTELTLDEIAAKFGVSVEQLKIKK